MGVFFMFIRDKNRTFSRVVEDVNTTNKMLREDVYDVLRCYELKSQAIEGIRTFVESLSEECMKGYSDGNREEVIRRVVSDIDSYHIDWPEEA